MAQEEARAQDPDARAPHEAPRAAITMQEQQDALREGRIIGFRCAVDGHQQFSPMLRCPRCHGRDIQRQEFHNTGRVVSYTIQSVASEQFLNETPFAFAIVQLYDGPRVSGWIPWIAKPKDLHVGQEVVYTPSYKPGMMFEKR